MAGTPAFCKTASGFFGPHRFTARRKEGNGMIIADRVTRTFSKGKVTALENVSLNIKQGERVGLIGKNGAGKTTFLKLVSGVLAPSGGSMWTFGKDPCRTIEENRRDMGVLFASYNALEFFKTLKEGCEMQRIFFGVGREAYEEVFQRIGQPLGIETIYERPLKTLSVGEKRCAGFFHSILHCPKLLLLDEPTIGVDAKNKSVICRALRLLNEAYGTTILMASHDVEALQEICSRSLLLKEGRLAFDGSWSHLKDISDTFRKARFYSENMLDFEDLPVWFFTYENGKMELLFSRKQISEKDLYAFLMRKGSVSEFCVEEPPLETVVCDILRGGV